MVKSNLIGAAILGVAVGGAAIYAAFHFGYLKPPIVAGLNRLGLGRRVIRRPTPMARPTTSPEAPKNPAMEYTFKSPWTPAGGGPENSIVPSTGPTLL